MSSRRGGKTPFNGHSPSLDKGKGVGPGYRSGESGASNNNGRADQLSKEVAKISLDSTQDGDWEVFTKKSKNKGGGNAIQWGTPSPTPNAWGQPNVAQKLGMNTKNGAGKPTGPAWQTQPVGRGTANPQTYNRNQEYARAAQPTAVAPPLQHGWQWPARAGGPAPPNNLRQGEDYGSDTGNQQNQSDADEDDDDDDDLIEDEDDDLMSDEFDSDGSVKSHETRKKHNWFKRFFEVLDKLTVQELNEPSRQWHCPACRNGPGAIEWYRGLQPLMAHAKTKGAKRVKLHRELAEILDEELYRRGTSVIPVGEVFGKWEGLRENVSDHDIVWPPMVVVRNTQLELDENDQKWIGMGNQELVDYFSSYKAVKARHSYGPKGHRGLSLLIFESSVVGYHEAERLHKHFSDQGTDRNAWDTRRVLFYPGGKRQLYGYMANKEDLDEFNKHCTGKMKLKFEMRSYQEMVVAPMRQMSEDNQQLVWLKNKVAKEQKHSKTLEESFGVLSQKLRKTMEENRIVRRRTTEQHEETKAQMDYQENFYNEKITSIRQDLEKKEKAFEELLQEERKKVKQQSTATSKTQEDGKLSQEEVAKFIQSQAKGIEEFEAERDKLIKIHEDKKAEMKRKHMEEEVELEKEFDSCLTKLMDKYAPRSSSA